jgi:hypothetical protein
MEYQIQEPVFSAIYKIDFLIGIKGGYKFSGNTYEIFEKFFGTSNPNTIALDGNHFAFQN